MISREVRWSIKGPCFYRFHDHYFFPPVALRADGDGVQISSLPLSTAKRLAAHLVQSHRHHQGIRQRHSRGCEPSGRDTQEDY